MSDAPRLEERPIHLGLGATAVPQPPFTGIEWYSEYSERHDDDGAEGRLVSMHRFSESWDSWEMHPQGEEVVLCLEGAMTIHQEHADGTNAAVTLEAGEYAINSPGHLAHRRYRGRSGGAVHHRRARHRAPPTLN